AFERAQPDHAAHRRAPLAARLPAQVPPQGRGAQIEAGGAGFAAAKDGRRPSPGRLVERAVDADVDAAGQAGAGAAETERDAGVAGVDTLHEVERGEAAGEPA